MKHPKGLEDDTGKKMQKKEKVVEDIETGVVDLEDEDTEKDNDDDYEDELEDPIPAEDEVMKDDEEEEQILKLVRPSGRNGWDGKTRHKSEKQKLVKNQPR